MHFTGEQIAAISILLVLFTVYGVVVRRGVLREKAVLWAGFPLGLLAVGVSMFALTPEWRGGRVPPGLLAFNAGLMSFCTAWCVLLAYRNQQRSTDVDTMQLGDTKIIVRVCSPFRLPDADILILPALTSLRLIDGPAGLVGTAAGKALGDELRAHGPVGLGKVVSTGAGLLAPGRILHVAVADALRPTDAAVLRRGMDTAVQQARKARAESLAVPVAPLRGLPLPASADAIVGAVLKQRKAFAEIIFVVFDPAYAKAVQTAITKLAE